MPASSYQGPTRRQPFYQPGMGTPYNRLGDTSHTVDPHSFFGSAPIMPPRGGAPFSFGGGAPQMSMGGGAPIDHPSLNGMRSLLSQLQAQNAEIAARPQGPSYMQRLMGGTTGFSDPALGARYAAASNSMAGPAPVGNPMAQTHAPFFPLFQGATPGMVAYGGGQRQGFLGAPAQPGGVGYDPTAFMRSHDLTFTPTGAMTPQSASRLMDYNKNKAALAAGHAQYMQGWNQKLAGRQALVQQHAMNKSNARDARLGIGDPLDMAQRMDPQIAGMMGMGQLGLQGQYMQNQLGWGALAQQHQAAQFQQNAALMKHIAGSDLPPGVKQQYMDKLLGGMGLGGVSSTPPTSMQGQQRVDFLLPKAVQTELMGAKSVKEKEAILNKHGITDLGVRNHVLGIGRNAPPSMLGSFMDWIARPFQAEPTPNTKKVVRGADGKPRAVPVRPSSGASGSWAEEAPAVHGGMPMY